MNAALWHLLQISDVLDMEMASALAESVHVLAWKPQRTLLPWLLAAGREEEGFAEISSGNGTSNSESAFRLRNLPLLRGFSRPPMSWIANTGSAIVERLLAQTSDPERSPLICSTPYFAAAAELWPGPVIYWLTDLIAEYSSARRSDVHDLDRRMCAVATLVCPNSRILKKYLVETANCDPNKIQIVPNATRAANVMSHLPKEPQALPFTLQGVKRPIAGVIGNLAGNMDWILLKQMVDETPWLTWAFVGPVDMHIANDAARKARSEVMRSQNTHFVGRQPYGELAGYARSFDVAVLPYLRCEPTYSGSSTRFYEHLAACRPMLATRGLEELKHKTPLLELFDTAAEGLAALARLRTQDFSDGRTNLRWQASQQATWQTRAQAIQEALLVRLSAAHASGSCIPA